MASCLLSAAPTAHACSAGACTARVCEQQAANKTPCSSKAVRSAPVVHAPSRVLRSGPVLRQRLLHRLDCSARPCQSRRQAVCSQSSVTSAHPVMAWAGERLQPPPSRPGCPQAAQSCRSRLPQTWPFSAAQAQTSSVSSRSHSAREGRAAELDLGKFPGPLLQGLEVYDLLPGQPVVVGGVQRGLEPEGVLPVDLLPVDGAIGAVGRLVAQLQAQEQRSASAVWEWSSNPASSGPACPQMLQAEGCQLGSRRSLWCSSIALAQQIASTSAAKVPGTLHAPSLCVWSCRELRQLCEQRPVRPLFPPKHSTGTPASALSGPGPLPGALP